MSEELFTVWHFSSDDWYVKAAEGLPAKLAVDYAHWLTQTQQARGGEIQRIIITNEANDAVLEWKFGEGVTFLTPEMRALHCRALQVLWWLRAAYRHVRAVLHPQ